MPRPNLTSKREADNAYVRERSSFKRDITEHFPDPGDLDRRESCERDLRRFLESYFPNAFNLRWSDDHLRAIGLMERVVLGGGLFALAMPRGAGKTTISVRSAIWAMLYGHRRFVSLVCATEKRAKEILKSIKTELSFNEDLATDFRQVCYPIQRLENNGRLAIGQLFDGKETRIDWSADRLTFPTMPDWACDGPNVSGSTVSVAGLTGSVRGQSHTLTNGEIIRPELVILDDPQTRESAMSPSQSETRTALINGDVLGMAGPGRTIAAIMPCTVIRSGDMADTILDRDKNPEWNGIKTKMLYSFPTNMKLWQQCWDMRSEDMRAERGIDRSNEFYRQNQEAMDAGSLVAWPERFDPETEVSALQRAMNLLFRNEDAFHAEYQNEPRVAGQDDRNTLGADQVVAKLNRIPAGMVPLACNRLTAMIDVQGTLLYYVVAAWEDDFTGYVVDYGTFPDQKRPYFAFREARITLDTVFPKASREGRIFAGLEALTSHLIDREWRREDDAVVRVERCLIDSGYATDTVLKFCRQSKHAGIVMPSKGMGLTPASRPFLEYQRRPGDRAGHHWRVPATQGRAIRQVLMDVNYWKSFLHTRLGVAMGDKGCLSLYGDKPERHRMLADHLTSESCDRQFSETYGRWVDVWKRKAGNPDNHLLDCLVGCAVAASMGGSALAESQAVKDAPVKRKRVSFAEQQRQHRA